MSFDPATGHQGDGNACEGARASLGAYALDALDAEESRAVAAHLAACPACEGELVRQERALAALGGAITPVAPPPLLRDRLLEAAEAEVRDLRRNPVEEAAAPSGRGFPSAVPRWSGPPVVLPRVAAIGLALVASLLVVGLVVAGVSFQRVQEERDAARAGQREIAEYLRNGGTVTPLVSMQGEATPSTGRGSLIVAPGQSGALLVVDGLAPSATNRSYRVWVARAGDRTRVDELRVGPDGTGWLALATAEPLVSYDTVGITLVNPDTSQHQDLLMAPIVNGGT